MKKSGVIQENSDLHPVLADNFSEACCASGIVHEAFLFSNEGDPKVTLRMCPHIPELVVTLQTELSLPFYLPLSQCPSLSSKVGES